MKPGGATESATPLKVVDLTMEDHRLSLMKDYKLSEALIQLPQQEAFANRLFSLKAQNMLNTPFGKTQLEKEISRQRIESLRKYHADGVLFESAMYYSQGDFDYYEEEQTNEKLFNREKMPDGKSVISLSVFSRP